MNNQEQQCCSCCGESLTAVEQLNVDKRRALTALQNASMAMASLDHESAKRHIRSARKHLTNHKP